MLRLCPLAVPRLGYRARIEDNAFSLFLHSRKSWLRWKSVEAERGSPSLTLTTQAKKIMDILHGSIHEDNLKTKDWSQLIPEFQAGMCQEESIHHHWNWAAPLVTALPLQGHQTALKAPGSAQFLPLRLKGEARELIGELSTWKIFLISLLLCPNAEPSPSRCWWELLSPTDVLHLHWSSKKLPECGSSLFFSVKHKSKNKF